MRQVQRRFPAVLAAIFALGLLIADSRATDVGASGGKVRLRLHLEKGKSYRLKMVTQQKIDQTIQGNEVKVNQTLGMDYAFHVQEVKADGTMTAKVTYYAVQMKMDGPMGKVDYDSAHPPAEIPAMAKGMAALVGESFTLDITPQGKVPRLEGLDEMLAKVIEKSELPAGPMKGTMQDQLKKQFGDKAMRDTMEQLMAIYPDKPVGVGDSWSKQVKLTKGFPMELENTYLLTSRKNGVATLSVKTTIKSDPKAEPLKMGPLSISYDLAGTQEGTTELDETTGWTIRAKAQQEFSGKMKMEGAPGMTGPMRWPITAKSTITIEAPK